MEEYFSNARSAGFIPDFVSYNIRRVNDNGKQIAHNVNNDVMFSAFDFFPRRQCRAHHWRRSFSRFVNRLFHNLALDFARPGRGFSRPSLLELSPKSPLNLARR